MIDSFVYVDAFKIESGVEGYICQDSSTKQLIPYECAKIVCMSKIVCKYEIWGGK